MILYIRIKYVAIKCNYILKSCLYSGIEFFNGGNNDDDDKLLGLQLPGCFHATCFS